MSNPTGFISPKVKTIVVHGLWVIMMSAWAISGDKGTTLKWNVDSGGDWGNLRTKDVPSSVISTQLCCETKTVLKLLSFDTINSRNNIICFILYAHYCQDSEEILSKEVGNAEGLYAADQNARCCRRHVTNVLIQQSRLKLTTDRKMIQQSRCGYIMIKKN